MIDNNVLQALDYLHNISDEKLLEEWQQIEALDLPYVDADEFVKDSMGKFDNDLLKSKKNRSSLLKKIACL